MRIFISSVRRGLEEERDALPGLIRALEHDPVMFEDFTAKSFPSRDACLQGVDSSDAYLLLMGEKYGDPLPETGQSPTHDEVVRAKHNGIARLVFVKSGVDMEPRQRELLDQLQAYSTGVFRGSFAYTTDLMTQVTAAVRDLENQPPVLEHDALTNGRVQLAGGLESGLRVRSPDRFHGGDARGASPGRAGTVSGAAGHERPAHRRPASQRRGTSARRAGHLDG